MAEPAASAGGTDSLWRNGAFTRLWFAQVVSNAGSKVTNLALPLTAAMTLGASPEQMGLLAMAGSLPNLLFGLLAGVWVDRARRRPILIGADLGRALLLGSIPLAASLGALTFAQLWIVAFASATLSIFSTIASVAVLPAVVRGSQLVEANSKLALSDSVLAIAGPGIAGGLIQLVSAPRAIVVDAASFVLSALSLRRVAISEAPRRGGRGGVWSEIREGMRALVDTPLLRALTVSGVVGTFGFSVQGAVLVLFLTRDLGLAPATIGLAYACGGAGSILGAAVAGRVGRRVGVGGAAILGNLLWALGALLVPSAGAAGPPLPLLVAGQGLAALGATVFSVNQMSLRQRITPVGVLGRVTAARRFLLFSLAPAGAAAGGIIGAALGLRLTLAIGALICLGSVLLVFLSPVRAARDLPDAGE